MIEKNLQCEKNSESIFRRTRILTSPYLYLPRLPGFLPSPTHRHRWCFFLFALFVYMNNKKGKHQNNWKIAMSLGVVWGSKSLYSLGGRETFMFPSRKISVPNWRVSGLLVHWSWKLQLKSRLETGTVPNLMPSNIVPSLTSQVNLKHIPFLVFIWYMGYVECHSNVCSR